MEDFFLTCLFWGRFISFIDIENNIIIQSYDEIQFTAYEHILKSYEHIHVISFHPHLKSYTCSVN